ncbi:pentapeptide repeat-containing protein [Actinoplanes bogorensis]|uniref:Pentapeptide repeat-containing protein n=1 Tax=Paractinoplanes bogorensis TaxID=1610840 RepID=A0ABS5YUD2_9ACTN|nr:pentapeptide repeat-containing protein [Actinoplanes bogorensis]
MAAAGVVAFVVMVRVAAHAPVADRPGLQIEAIKYGLGLFAAGGAAAALLLGFRRQQHTELDAAERRITDLYTKAVEQLGAESPAVRMGGMYALERIAQSNVDQRQTIVNVICAYLRTPFTPPSPDPSSADAQGQQELQVRLTAQSILTGHLRPSAAGSLFWPGIDLDLTGATLAEWRLSDAEVHKAIFTGATFSSPALFSDTVFTDAVTFASATFDAKVHFIRAIFTAKTTFERVAVHGEAAFSGALFHGAVDFSGASFAADADWHTTTFQDDAHFTEVRFDGNAEFTRANFAEWVTFRGSAFAGGVRFSETYFRSDAALATMLAEVRPLSQDDRRDVWPPGWRLREGTDGRGELLFTGLPSR